MEPNIIAPNLNTTVYREHIPAQPSIKTFLDCIEVHNDTMLLGSSNLNGRFWNGSLCVYDNFRAETDVKFDLEQYKAVTLLDIGVTDCKILADNRTVLASYDSGQMQLFTIEDCNMKYNLHDAEDHVDFITEISTWSSDDNFVTSSADKTIKLWSINEGGALSIIQTYNNAHSNLITSVSANKHDMTLFASCSHDKTALLWDKRLEEFSNVIYENEFCALTRIDWHPGNSNLVAISNSMGHVYLVDIREPKEILGKNSYFKRRIHRIRFNSKGLLAVCADDTKLIVLDCIDGNDEMQIVYSNDQHNDFVRGFAWKEDVLVSCGWDKQVLVHKF